MHQVFEIIPDKQRMPCMIDVLSNYITGFWKLHGSQQCQQCILIKLKKSGKNALGKGDFVCAIFMDLWKTAAGVVRGCIDSPLLYNMQCKETTLMATIQLQWKQQYILLDFKTLTGVFYDNYMITNLDRYSHIFLGKSNNDGTLSFNEFNLKNSEEKLF